jgi:hypothetical protein
MIRAAAVVGVEVGISTVGESGPDVGVGVVGTSCLHAVREEAARKSEEVLRKSRREKALGIRSPL